MSIMTDHAMSTVADQVTALNAIVVDLIGHIRALQDDLIEQYNTDHAKPYTGGFDDEDTAETECICLLDCIMAHIKDVERDVWGAMELLGVD